ncbi:MAG TPA: thermonuclease family protein, partial [Candidatus Limnocylindrales bacterium]|nr:thermonuclease family protein [Candidatus Limnocylindrales bacterium]
MTGDARFCPQCGSQRAGFFRFCWKCGFDYDEFLPPEARRAADPKQPAPTKSTLARPGVIKPKAPPTPAPAPAAAAPTPAPAAPVPAPAAGPQAPVGTPPAPAIPAAATTPSSAKPAPTEKSPVAVPVRRPVPRVVEPAARPTTPAAAVATAPPLTTPLATPRQPAVWPPPGAMPAEDLEPQAPVATPAPRVSTNGLGRRAVATVPVASPAITAVPATRVRPTRPSTRRRPDLTLTRIAIVVLAALLAFSAVSNFVRSNSATSRSVAPTIGLETPITAESPGAAVESPDIAISTFGPAGETTFATVTKVVDGDTIKVDIDGTEYSVRYIGIDSPEPDATDPDIKRLADAATATNASLVEGQEVYLEREVSDMDRFGRLLRDVWLVDSGGSQVLISIELVRAGYAQISTFPPDVRYLSQLTEAQTMAQDDRVGLWGLDSPPAPADETPAAEA